MPVPAEGWWECFCKPGVYVVPCCLTVAKQVVVLLRTVHLQTILPSSYFRFAVYEYPMLSTNLQLPRCEEDWIVWYSMTWGNSSGAMLSGRPSSIDSSWSEGGISKLPKVEELCAGAVTSLVEGWSASTVVGKLASSLCGGGKIII